jgi:phosphoribosylaminoimidazole carboxylase
MMADPAHRLGVKLLFLDSGHDTPAKQISHLNDEHVDGSFADAAKVLELAAKCDVLTVEIEHVDVAALERAKEANPALRIHPSPACIAVIQDKYRQKQHMGSHEVPATETRELIENTRDEIYSIAVDQGFGFPIMLKTKLNAYDGRGNAVIRTEKDIDAALQALSPSTPQPLYVEKWVPFTKELAVMVVRTPENVLASYPCVETVHRENICHTVVAPAQVDGLVQRRARKVAERAVQCLPEGAGVYGVEMFLLESGSLLEFFSALLEMSADNELSD